MATTSILELPFAGIIPSKPLGLPEQVLLSYTPLLVDTGAQRILIDSGAGSMAPSTGHLEESLPRSGFQVSEIDVVVLSHLHPDHIGGLPLEDGTLRFPNARVLMSGREYDFWHSADLRSRLGNGSLYGSPELEALMGAWIDKYLPPVRDRLEWLAEESEIASGIEAIHAPVTLRATWRFRFPPNPNRSCMQATCCFYRTRLCIRTGPSIFDLDAPELISTRHQLLDRAATDRTIVFHYHLGDAGRFVRRGAQFAWEQLT